MLSGAVLFFRSLRNGPFLFRFLDRIGIAAFHRVFKPSFCLRAIAFYKDSAIIEAPDKLHALAVTGFGGFQIQRKGL